MRTRRTNCDAQHPYPRCPPGSLTSCTGLYLQASTCRLQVCVRQPPYPIGCCFGRYPTDPSTTRFPHNAHAVLVNLVAGGAFFSLLLLLLWVAQCLSVHAASTQAACAGFACGRLLSQANNSVHLSTNRSASIYSNPALVPHVVVLLILAAGLWISINW